MTEHCPDRELGIPKVSCHACEGVAEYVHCDIVPAELVGDAFHDARHADEMPFADRSLENEVAVALEPHFPDDVEGGLAHDTHLGAGLGVGKPHDT